jgi:hypothetical protein
MNFGQLTSEEDSFATMDKALELGINYFDTGPGRKSRPLRNQLVSPNNPKGHSPWAAGLRTDVHYRPAQGWLLHCGDAYTRHGDVDPEHPSLPPYHRLLGPLFNVNKAMRLIGAHAPRLRVLLQAHGDDVRLTCTHNPHELEKFLEGKLS